MGAFSVEFLFSFKKLYLWDFPGGPVARIHAPNAGGLGSIPGQGTRSHMSQLRVRMLQLKGPACRN